MLIKDAFVPRNRDNPLSTPVMDMINGAGKRDLSTKRELSENLVLGENDINLPTVNERIEKRNFQNTAEDKCFGILYGMTLGDAIGARLEFETVCYDTVFVTDMGDKTGGEFYLKPGQWTDDTSMGLCLCDSLLLNNGTLNEHDLMQRFLAWWELGYNNAFRFDEKQHSVGLGGNISEAFIGYLRGESPGGYTTAGDSNTSGNGSVMRLGGVPVCFWDDVDLAQDIAERQSRTTHRGDEAAECCRLLTYLTVSLINGAELKEALENLGKNFKSKVKSVQHLANSEIENNDPDRNWRWMTSDYKYSPKRAKERPDYIGAYAMDATAMALHCVFSTATATDAILKAVNLCGDADSVGSVAGQVAGAAYGFSAFPKEWIVTVGKWDKNEIGLRAFRLYHKKWL